MKAVHIMRSQLREYRRQLLVLWRYTGFIFGLPDTHASPLGLSRHTGFAHNRKRKVRPSSIRVMLADTICSSLLILADMKHQRRADGQMARNYTSANCFLTLFWVCVYRHSAGVVRSSQNEAQVMTMSG